MHIDVPRSPPQDMEETDYVDLLLEYKQIQKQLESIKQEEERASHILPTKEGTIFFFFLQAIINLYHVQFMYSTDKRQSYYSLHRLSESSAYSTAVYYPML